MDVPRHVQAQARAPACPIEHELYQLSADRLPRPERRPPARRRNGGCQRVVRLLEHLILRHDAPRRITVDNDPEFIGQFLDAWAYEHGVTLGFIDPVRQMQHGYLESLNGKFRCECLNAHWFHSPADHRRMEGVSTPSGRTERGAANPAERELYYQPA